MSSLLKARKKDCPSVTSWTAPFQITTDNYLLYYEDYGGFILDYFLTVVFFTTVF
jgi:hypothetical protein